MFDIDFQGQNLFVILFQYFSLILLRLSFNLEKDSSLYLISIKSSTIGTQKWPVCASWKSVTAERRVGNGRGKNGEPDKGNFPSCRGRSVPLTEFERVEVYRQGSEGKGEGETGENESSPRTGIRSGRWKQVSQFQLSRFFVDQPSLPTDAI